MCDSLRDRRFRYFLIEQVGSLACLRATYQKLKNTTNRCINEQKIKVYKNEVLLNARGIRLGCESVNQSVSSIVKAITYQTLRKYE